MTAEKSSVASGYVGNQGAQKNREHDKKQQRQGGSNFPPLRSPGNPGAKTSEFLHKGIIFGRSLNAVGLESKVLCLSESQWKDREAP